MEKMVMNQLLLVAVVVCPALTFKSVLVIIIIKRPPFNQNVPTSIAKLLGHFDNIHFLVPMCPDRVSNHLSDPSSSSNHSIQPHRVKGMTDHRPISKGTKVLIVRRDDDQLFLTHQEHPLDIRAERDNPGALSILTRLQKKPKTPLPIHTTTSSNVSIHSELKAREHLYRKRNLFAWHAAVSMPHSKKVPFETEIPVAATRFLKRKPSKCEQIRRHIVKIFRCGAKSLYVADVVTQHSIDTFNNNYNAMKDVELLHGYGIKRRKTLFTTSPNPTEGAALDFFAI